MTPDLITRHESATEPRCTCLRRDIRYMDDPYSEPPILRRDPDCEVHGIDPDSARDARIDDTISAQQKEHSND